MIVAIVAGSMEFLLWIIMGFHKKFKMQYLQMIRLALGLIEVRNEWRSLSFELSSSLIVLLTYLLYVFRYTPAMPTYKAIGVQTEGASDPAQVILHDDPLACHALSEKLLAIWGSPGDQKHGRNLISKLLVTCQTDFHVLFGFMSMNISKLTMDSLADGSSDVALKFHKHSFHTSEAAKVSHLYSILTKVLFNLLLHLRV